MSKQAGKQAIAVVLAGKPTSDVLGLLEEKIKSLKHIEETVYKTTGNLDGFPDIKTEMKIENLVRAMGSVLAREQNYIDGARALGLDVYPAFSVSGGNKEAWLHDIKHRIAVISQKDTLDQLNAFKTKITGLMSATEQKEMIMNDLAAFLTK